MPPHAKLNTWVPSANTLISWVGLSTAHTWPPAQGRQRVRPERRRAGHVQTRARRCFCMPHRAMSDDVDQLARRLTSTTVLRPSHRR